MVDAKWKKKFKRKKGQSRSKLFDKIDDEMQCYFYGTVRAEFNKPGDRAYISHLEDNESGAVGFFWCKLTDDYTCDYINSVIDNKSDDIVNEYKKRVDQTFDLCLLIMRNYNRRMWTLCSADCYCQHGGPTL